MAVAGEQILTRLGFEVDEISLKSSLEKVAAFGSALRRAFADASAALVGVAKGEAEVAAQADALGVSVERFAEWRFIAEQTGASADALEASLKAMLANNPGLSDAASELERAGGAMREMGDAQREAYARGLGIDPSLIPMLTQDVSGLRDMFRSLYATAGTDAAQAAEDSKGFLDGMARLAGLCDLLAKTVALSLLGTARSGIEALGDAFVAHFDDIRRVLELAVALASAAAPVIGAALGLLVSWGGQLAGLLGTLDADLVAGIGKGIAVFMTLRGAVGAAIIGFANLKEAWTLLTAAFSANPYLLAIGAAVTLAVVVMDNWDAVKAFLLGVWDAVASGVRAAVDAVASAFDNAVNFVTGAGSAIAGAVGPAVSSAMGFVGAAVSGAADLLASAFGGAADVVSGLFSGMGAAIGIALQGIMDGFRLLGGLAAAIFSGDLSGALDAGIGLFRNFGETALGVFPALGEGILGGLSSLWGRVTEAFPDFGAWASGVAESVGSAFSGAAESAGTALSSTLDAVGPAVSGVAEALAPVVSGAAEAVSSTVSGVAGAVSSACSGVAGFVGPAVSGAVEAAGSAFSSAAEAVAPAVSGLAEAAVSAFGGVADTLGAAFGNVADAASSAFSGALDVVGPAASEAADRLSSALSGAVAFVSDRFPSLGAAAEAVGQGLASEFQSIRDSRGLRVLGGSFRRAGCGARAVLGLPGNGFRHFRGARGSRARRVRLRVGTGHGVLPGLRRVGGKLGFGGCRGVRQGPRLGAGKALRARRHASRLGAGKARLEAAPRCGRGGRYARIPRSVRPRRAGRPRRERRFRIRRPFLRERFLRECLGGGFRCGRFLRRRLESGLCGRRAFGWRFRRRSCGRLGYGRFRGGRFWGGRPRRSILPGRFRRLLRGRSGKLRTGKGAGGRLLPRGPFRARLRDAAVLLPLHGSLPNGRPVAVGGDGLRRRRGFAGIQDGNQRQRRKLAG